MAEKMTYEQMVEKACEALGGKFASRTQIKTYLTKNFGYANSATAKNALKKALTKFEKKGDSFRVSKAMKGRKASAMKKATQKVKLVAKKAVAKEKLAAKKAKLIARKAAAKEKLAKKKEAAKAKKALAAAKKTAKKAASKAKKASKPKKTTKKATKKKAIKKPVKKLAKKTVAKKK